ncbi:MAG: 5'/3'-nucleotidase SurE [Bulleidia sp.]
MRILLVNDDGIDAPGIQALMTGFRDTHEVYVCAPVSQRSGYSHSATYFSRDLKVEERHIEGTVKSWAVDGTPADCAYFGIYAMMDVKPDLVISGINQGQNMGADLIYSGTIGAAAEGLVAKIPSIAVSYCSYTDTDYRAAVKVTRMMADWYMKEAEHDYVLSINVPSLPYEQLKGLRWTTPSPARDFARKLKRTQLDDKVCTIGVDGALPAETIHPLVGTDTYEVSRGYVSLTPVGLDPTFRDRNMYLKDLPEL